MGLDMSHDAWSGAYSAFSRFRDKLTEVAGYDMPIVKDDGLFGIERPMPDIDWDQYPEAGYYDPPFIPQRRDGTQDPLLLLVMHSDCEGKIRSAFLTPLADRLEELLPALEGQDGGGHIGPYADKARTLIAGCRAAAANGEDLEFY